MEDVFSAIAYLNEEVKRINRRIDLMSKRPEELFKGEWMDGNDVKRAFNISTRTLCTMRTTGILTPTRLLKKNYYKVSDIKTLLQKNYIRNHKKHNRNDEETKPK